MVGLLPLCAVTVFEGKLAAKYPEISSVARAYLQEAASTNGFHS